MLPSNSFTLGGGIGMVSGWGAGCLDRRAVMVTSLSSANVSSGQAKRTAPLKSPSSNLIETLVANLDILSTYLLVEG